MSEEDDSMAWKHINHRCDTGCIYCRVAQQQARIEAMMEATLPLHRKIVAFQDYYNADDCFVIDEAIALDIMALGGDDSALAALLESED